MENALVGLVCPATMENAPLLAPRVHHQSDAPTAAETSARSRSIPAPGATAPAARGGQCHRPCRRHRTHRRSRSIEGGFVKQSTIDLDIKSQREVLAYESGSPTVVFAVLQSSRHDLWRHVNSGRIRKIRLSPEDANATLALEDSTRKRSSEEKGNKIAKVCYRANRYSSQFGSRDVGESLASSS